LFAEPPGTGKSFLIKAFAKELGWCPLRLVSKWREACNSKQTLEMALCIIETVQPCIVWIDIDMEWGEIWSTGLSSDVSNSGKIMGRLLEAIRCVKRWGKILWIGETTRPDILPLNCLNCFPVLIPFLHPSAREIQMLLPALARQIGRELAEDVNTFEIAQVLSPNLPTARVLQEVINAAGFFADTETGQPGTPIRQCHLLRAAHKFKPNYNLFAHEYMALTAIRMCSFSFLLPWRTFDGRRRTDYELPKYLKGIVDEATGEVDIMALDRRLSELRVSLSPQRLR